MNKIILISVSVIVLNLIGIYSQDIKEITGDIQLIKLNHNTYLHRTSRASTQYGRISGNGLIYIQNSKAIMFDTPWNNELTRKLCDCLSDSLKVKVTMVVPTHWHDDCMGGLEEMHRRNAVSYAHDKTKKIAIDTLLPVPINTFSDSIWINFEDKKIMLFYPGGGHTIDNIVCWIPEHKIIFGGCMIKSLNARSIGNTRDAILSEWANSLTRTKERFKDALMVVPGHGEPSDLRSIDKTIEIVQSAQIK